jgi:S1-C subfamily serine protease
MKMSIKIPLIVAILFTIFLLSCVLPLQRPDTTNPYLYPGQQTVLDLDNAHVWAREHIANPSSFAVKTQSFADVQIYDNPEKTGKPRFHVRKSMGGGIGGGTVIADKGYLLTAKHVVDDADVVAKVDEIVADTAKKNPGTFIVSKVSTEYTLTDHTGKDFLAVKVALGEDDLGLMQAKEPDKFTGTPVKISREKNLSDKTVIMIGTPLGINDVMMDGRVAREKIMKKEGRAYMYVIAPIVPGNSGGALITLGDMMLSGVITDITIKMNSLTSIALFIPNDIINEFLEKNLPKQ